MKIAIIGFGVVGSGAYETAKSVADLEVTAILSRHIRAGYEDIAHIFKKSIDDIVTDPEIELVIESIGGTDIAKEYVLKCLKAGKHVVTPNKNLISACYDELSAIARENNVKLAYTASAGGGIPWLFNLRRTRRTDHIKAVRGIVNGTCNYILDAMHQSGASFEDMLKDAQKLGYAESNPAADIEGTDTLRKTVISANTAFGTSFTEDQVPCFGIDRITGEDIRWFNEHGYACRLMMNAKLCGESAAAYVEPTLFTASALEASVGKNNNLITLEGDCVGTLAFFGPGAGQMPTGESVIQDVIDIRDGVMLSCLEADCDYKVDNSAELHRYYLRCDAACTCFDDILESAEVNGDIKHCITKPVSVSDMHKAADNMLEKGLAFFMAGLGE